MSTATHNPNSATDAGESEAPGAAALQGELRTVRNLEASIAERLEAARDSREVLLTATQEADSILEAARAQAAESADAARESAQVDALRAAERIRNESEQRCATIAATAATRRDDDVAAVLAGVLPTAANPSHAQSGGSQVLDQEPTS